eukprot:Skav214407  [mRNA]  locus=scaffold3796:11842:12981:- [translate_table: standard]
MCGLVFESAVLVSASALDPQDSVGKQAVEIAKDMSTHGYKTHNEKGVNNRVDVVEMENGSKPSLDNRRVAAAKMSNTDVKAHLHHHTDALPEVQKDRFPDCKTYGEAIKQRMSKQGQEWQKANPDGADSLQAGKVKGNDTRVNGTKKELPEIHSEVKGGSGEIAKGGAARGAWDGRRTTCCNGKVEAYVQLKPMDINREKIKTKGLPQAVKEGVKDRITKPTKPTKADLKNAIKPKATASVGAVCSVIDHIDRPAHADAGVLRSDAGEYQTRTSKGVAANAAVAEARAQASICQASAEVLTASAGASYGAAGLQAHARATLARAEASAGPVQVGVGLNLDCGASVGPDGLQITLFGFGFSLGPRAGVRTPVADAQCSVM